MPRIIGMALYGVYRWSSKLKPRTKHILRGAVFVVWARLHGLHHGFYSSIAKESRSHGVSYCFPKIRENKTRRDFLRNGFQQIALLQTINRCG